MGSIMASMDDTKNRMRHSETNNKWRNAPGPELSIAVEENKDKPKSKGQGVIRRHPLCQEHGLIDLFDDKILTLYDCFESAVKKFADSDFLGVRKVDGEGVAGEYSWTTYGQVHERVKMFGSGLLSFGLKECENIGIYSINRPEWFISEYACYFANFVTVPLYDTLGDDAIKHICNQTEMKVIIASNCRAINILTLKEEIPLLDTIICMDDKISDTVLEMAKEHNVEIFKFSIIEKRGGEEVKQPRCPKPSDLCTICYTSGTTGLPKGVMLPHSALVADAAGALSLCGIGKCAMKKLSLFSINPNAIHLSYLPLAHVYERVVMTVLASNGAKVGFYQGDIAKLLDDIATLKPTIFVTVPRLLNRVYDKVLAGVAASGSLKKFIFEMAYKSKLEGIKSNSGHTHWLWDRIVFKPIRERLGGRVQTIITGSAPMCPDVMDFLRVCFSCDVLEGYGQTETCAGSTATLKEDLSSGQVGIPIPCNEVMLVDVPEMGYTNKDTPNPRGEICIRGPNCFSGYYKLPEMTAETLDAQGWVHTGDIGEWDCRGRLKIIDRKKNLFKLAQGEYISPEKIEAVICRTRYISQAFVDGSSLKSYLVAVVVPDLAALQEWSSKHAPNCPDLKSLATNPALKTLLLNELKALGKGGSKELKGFEIPRNIYVESEEFSVDNDVLTSTMKLKRHQARQKYAHEINTLYDEADKEAAGSSK